VRSSQDSAGGGLPAGAQWAAGTEDSYFWRRPVQFYESRLRAGKFSFRESAFCEIRAGALSAAAFSRVGRAVRIAWHEKTLGQLFCDGSARTILDMLLEECERGGVEVVLNAREIAVEASSSGFRVSSSHGEFWAESLVVATGVCRFRNWGQLGWGMSSPRNLA